MKILLLMVMSFCVTSFANDGFKYILMEPQMQSILPQSKNLSKFRFKNGTLALRVNENTVDHIAHNVHEKYKRCGGFFSFDSHEDLMSFVSESRAARMKQAQNKFFGPQFPTSIKRDERIAATINKVKEIEVRKTIKHLSSYKNRYLESKTGVAAAKWIGNHWLKLLKGRKDASLEFVKHRFAQPSIIVKIEGKTKDAVVIGGHIDSISKCPRFSPFCNKSNLHAPGADDNASGIATITEIIRAIGETSFKPNKTLFFMGYAGEEKGLLGSKHIARKFTRRGSEYTVKGVLQFDMTNFQASPDELYFVTDHTNAELTSYLGVLLDEYVKIKWGTAECGYGCSDHASWHAMGVPAVYPTEGDIDIKRRKGFNLKIHTSEDLIDESNGRADQATNFAKLGLAFALDFAAK